MNGPGASALAMSRPHAGSAPEPSLFIPPYVLAPGATATLPGLLARLTPPDLRSRRGRIVLLHGGHLIGRPGWSAISAALAGFDHHTLVHVGVPTPDSVAELSGRLIDHRVDVVVAVGGGAVLDAAKAAAVLAAEPVRPAPATVLGACDKPHDQAVPIRVVAVPTTPGTGAEVTPFATVWDHAEGRKLSLAGQAVRPAAAILDPGLLAGLPLRVLAGGALDSIAQGAESAWSCRATELSTELGLRAVREAGGCLDRLRARRTDPEVLLRLQRAGHLSGQAMAEAQTTSVHAVSYPLTLRHGLAHGHACGVVFGRLADFNCGVTAKDCADSRGVARVRDVLDRIAAALDCGPGGLTARLDRFLTEVGLRPLDELGIDPAAVAAEAESYPRCHDNPRRFDERLADLLADRAGGP